MFFSSKIIIKKTEVNKKMIESTDIDVNKIIIKNKRVTAESDMKTEEKNKQIVIKAVTAIMTETDIKMKRITNFRFKKNIRLLAAIQMILKVLFIF